jgi:hypothetical protein
MSKACPSAPSVVSGCAITFRWTACTRSR